MLPEGWRVRQISDVLQKVSRPVDVRADEYYEQIGVRSHGKGIFHKEAVTGAELGGKRVFWVEPECLVLNIVFAWEQAVAKTTQAEIGKIASHRFPMYRPRNGAADIDFLTYYFRTPRGKYLLGLASPGGAGRNKTLGQAEFERLEIALPPLAEQRKIAEILATWDQAIAISEKLLTNAETQKRALLQQLLTATVKLPGFKDRKWSRVQLGDAVEIIYGKSPAGIQVIDGPYPIIGTGGEVGRTDQWYAEGPAIVIGRKGTIDKPAFIKGKFWPIDTTFFCKPKRGFVAEWLFQAMLAIKWRRYNEASGVPSLSRETIRGITLNVPQEDEQQAIVATLEHADKLIDALAADVEKLKSEKYALVQQLLTGKRRVLP